MQIASPSFIDREQCSPVCPGPRVKLVVQATPPNPTFQSTEVPHVVDELFVILTTVADRGDGAVRDAMYVAT